MKIIKLKKVAVPLWHLPDFRQIKVPRFVRHEQEKNPEEHIKKETGINTLEQIVNAITGDANVRKLTDRYRDKLQELESEDGLTKELQILNDELKSLHKWKASKGYVKKGSHAPRLQTKKDVTGHYKHKWLIHLYFSCRFDGKGVRLSNVTSVTGLLTFDFENLTPDTLAELKKDPNIIVLAPSASSHPNYWALVYCDGLTIKNYHEQWITIERHFVTKYGIAKSDQIIDATRIRYMASCEPKELTVNYNAIPFVAEARITVNFDEITVKQKKMIGEYLNSEPQWTPFVWSCRAAMGDTPGARDMIKNFSRLAPDYKDANIDDKVNDLFKRWDGRIGVGSLRYRLVEWGVSFTVPTRSDTTFSELVWDDRRQMLIMNDSSYRLDDKTLKEKWYAENILASQEEDSKLTALTFNSWMDQEIAIARRVNPIEDFFKTPWDGVDYYTKLAGFITFDADKNINKTKAALFAHDLKKHIIRGIHQILANDDSWEINRYVFTIQGGYHIGKSTLLRRITLVSKRGLGFGGEFSIDDHHKKDSLTKLCQYINLICEEVDTITRHEIVQMKPLISYSGGPVRLPYGRQDADLRRMATLWASVNPKEFIIEGEMRWLVYSILKIDFRFDKEVKFEHLWHQAYSEWLKNPLAGRMTPDELKRMNNSTEEYIVVGSLDQQLQSCYKGDRTARPISLSEIKLDLELRVSDHALGRVLTRLFGDFRAPYSAVGKKGAHYSLVKGNF